MEENPQRDLIFATLVRFGLTIALCSLPFFLFGKVAEAAGLMLLILFPCSFMLAKPVMEWLIIINDWFSRQPLKRFQGRYYSFAGVQIRVHEVGRTLWFIDSDVLRVIDQKPSLMLESLYDAHEYDQIPDSRYYGFSEEGMEKLLMASDHYEAKRMLLWLRRDVIKPHRRKLEIAKERANAR